MKVQIINKSENELPVYKTEGSAGMDVKANFDNVGELKGKNFSFNRITQEVTILPGGRVLVPTGLYVALPKGTHLDVRPRSGLALKKGLTVLNTPGLIDEDYRGEIGIIIVNVGGGRETIKHGDDVAQLVLMKYEKADWKEVEVLDETERGEGGFGSTDEKKPKAPKTKAKDKVEE